MAFLSPPCPCYTEPVHPVRTLPLQNVHIQPQGGGADSAPRDAQLSKSRQDPGSIPRSVGEGTTPRILPFHRDPLVTLCSYIGTKFS